MRARSVATRYSRGACYESGRIGIGPGAGTTTSASDYCWRAHADLCRIKRRLCPCGSHVSSRWLGAWRRGVGVRADGHRALRLAGRFVASGLGGIGGRSIRRSRAPCAQRFADAAKGICRHGDGPAAALVGGGTTPHTARVVHWIPLVLPSLERDRPTTA